MDSTSAPPQPPAVSHECSLQALPQPAKVSTASIVATMLQVSKQVSDLIFSPGRAPQIELNGQLKEVNIAGVGKLTPDATRRIAVDLIGKNELVAGKLEKEGSTDLSYSLPGIARFRVNIFRQRGTYAIVMRVIPNVDSGFQVAQPAGAIGRNRGIAQWHRPGDGPDRVRKILDAGRYLEQNQ